MKNKISIVAIVLAIVAIIGEAFIFVNQRDEDDEMYQKTIRNNYQVFAPLLPDTMTFAGEKVPLELFYVYEGLDRELSSIMYQQLNTQLVMKRTARYFPMIEEILREKNIPEDFKYLCVTESSLTNATSPAKAQGFWQFMNVTAKEYGLQIDEDVDMRNDVEAATRAACKHFQYLYNRFGEWTIVAAAYNRGHNGLARQMEEQQETVYYDMHLNQETSRYVYRILAYKQILQHPQDYGFNLRHCDLYAPIPFVTDTLRGRNVDLMSYAKRHGCNYKLFKIMNPWLITDVLKNKEGRTYVVKLPIDNGADRRVILNGKKDTSIVDSF